MKKTLVLAVSALAFVSSAALAVDTTMPVTVDATTTTSADATVVKPVHKQHHRKKAVHRAHVAKKGDASPEESSTK